MKEATKRIFLWLPAVITFIAVSCSPGIRISSDYDKDVNISDYKTYSWLGLAEIEGRGMNPVYYNELNDKRIKAAVDKEMQAKGYTLTTGNADFQLHYHIIVEDKTSIIEEPGRFRETPYWQTRRVYTYLFREGSLIIDLMDYSQNTLVWRGTATGVVTEKASSDPEGSVKKAVTEIFKVFPYAIVK